MPGQRKAAAVAAAAMVITIAAPPPRAVGRAWALRRLGRSTRQFTAAAALATRVMPMVPPEHRLEVVEWWKKIGGCG
ncbi:MAG: hypothetical protein EBS56_02070 [Planctomycetia bacterium]|nr:hypothetical protein [Planctomycetia bacterium]